MSLLDTIRLGFADISLAQITLVMVVTLFASIVGGVAGYGTGALMPLVLVPLIGAAPVVPIISISALMSNAGRVAAFRPFVSWRRALIVMVCAIPTCALGAYGYTLLTGKGAAFLIGAMLILSVPLRRVLKRRQIQLGERGLAVGAAGYGVLVGGTAGSGVILLSLLMASGLSGASVVATDAIITIAIGIIKVSVFGFAGVLTPQVTAFGLLIGAVAFPGGFLAKALIARMPVHIHTAMLDAVVILGGVVMMIAAVR